MWTPLVRRIRTLVATIRRSLFTRQSAANIMMLSFILLTAVGAGMIFVPAGFITAGVACGLYGFLMGSE